jgi:hypothetical protein
MLVFLITENDQQFFLNGLEMKNVKFKETVKIT